MATPARTRLGADERRELVLVAAVAEFAVTGYHGTPAEAIARRSGISQPYLFRLYGTKRDLFVACIDRCFDRVQAAFRAAVAAAPSGQTALDAMGGAYLEMLADRELLLFQLQGYAAAADEEIRAAARRRWERLIDDVEALSGADRDEVLRFAGQGMLLNVAAALELDPARWLWTQLP